MLVLLVLVTILAVASAAWCWRALHHKQVQLVKVRESLAAALQKLRVSQEARFEQEDDHGLTEHKLRGYLHLMDAVVNAVPNPIYFKDLNGVYLGCNAMYAERILGLTRDRIIGRRAQELPAHIPADLAATCQRHELTTMQNRKFNTLEASVRCSDGVAREYLFSMAPICDTQGQAMGCVSVLVDLTGKNRAARDRMQKEKLQGVLETAGAVCHEFNQPLQAFSGWVDILSMNASLDASAQEVLEKINEQVDRMGQITAKLQGITRYETIQYAGKTNIIDIHKAAENDSDPKDPPIR